MLKKRFFLLSISLLLILTIFIGIGNQQSAQAKDKIVIGMARAFSGPLALTGDNAFTPLAEMWLEEVNEKGGLYIEEYGKKLPVEVIKYDTKSDTGTMTRLLERLIVEDKVDFIFSPISTAHLFAAAPIANKHEYILIGMEGGARRLKEYMEQLPYFFSAVNFSTHQVPVLVDILVENDIKSVAIVYITDLHGVEYSEATIPLLEEKGIKIEFCKSVPTDSKDLSPVLKEAKAADVDAFIAYTYPNGSILITKQAKELDYNPKMFVVGAGSCFEAYKNAIGEEVVEGIVSLGAWNQKSSPGAKEFYDKFTARFGRDKLDWWGNIPQWSALKFFEKAIVEAGTLDQEVIRDVMATQKFETPLGTTWFENGGIADECYLGQIGQWQDGQYEVIGPEDKATAPIIHPKPEWP